MAKPVEPMRAGVRWFCVLLPWVLPKDVCNETGVLPKDHHRQMEAHSSL